MKITILITILLFFNVNYSQSIDCNDLYEFIIDKGYKKSTLNNYTLNSSWLKKVTEYTYNYKTYVVAEIKKDEYSYQTNTYILCGIPNSNWFGFQYGNYGDSDSYGKRFHKYIINYKCNCE